jgi:hypothetical protein
VRRPLFSMSPRPTGRMLPSHLRSTSLWSAFRPSLKVCWLHLIRVKSAVLQAMTTPCLHLKPLDLLSGDLMFAFVHTLEDFLFLVPVHPMRLHRRHVFALHRRGFVSAASPTRRAGACETWVVPTGPNRPGSLSSTTRGPDLPEDPPTCPWTLPDLTCGPKDVKTAWCTRQDSPARISFPCCNRVG